MKKFKLRKQEKDVIKILKSLEEIWPDSLWMYSASGTLCIMRAEFGTNKRAMKKDFEGYDQDYIVDTIDIPNDGGDF